MPKAISTAPATAPVNRRSRKNRMSSMGCGVCSSQRTKAASTARPIAQEAATYPENQPCSGPEMIA